ncbi:KilA-N domain-containing protein [Pseudomonas sp. CCOS 191]|uniref:KilA-N domain-containing protein n=1 Tax=Pseudomonas sp. CCOS 191 TaxID=1649877 RepID=UPI001E5468AA|nr:KilA-N domain-containing protein [Pseudomonas sp. CCOS 191]
MQLKSRSGSAKSPNEWLWLPDNVHYLEGLQRRYGKIPYEKISRVRADRGGGTWLHPKLAVKFARWLSLDFEILV